MNPHTEPTKEPHLRKDMIGTYLSRILSILLRGTGRDLPLTFLMAHSSLSKSFGIAIFSLSSAQSFSAESIVVTRVTG